MDHIPDDLLDLQSRFVQWRANRKCKREPIPDQLRDAARKSLIALFCFLTTITVSASAQNVSPPIVPDPAKTPGDTLAATKADICVPGYSKKVRNVPESVKKQADRESQLRAAGIYVVFQISEETRRVQDRINERLYPRAPFRHFVERLDRKIAIERRIPDGYVGYGLVSIDLTIIHKPGGFSFIRRSISNRARRRWRRG